jgi:mannose/cellobiose epimerase-like protein (N-acyl-D-glucosamine 2-epimerase family)
MSPDSPVWRDQLSRDGTEVSTTIPAGNLYHIVLALAEADRVLGPGVQPAA